jgi:hypothetical protein
MPCRPVESQPDYVPENGSHRCDSLKSKSKQTIPKFFEFYSETDVAPSGSKDIN